MSTLEMEMVAVTLSVVALTHIHRAQMRPGNAVCLQPSKKQMARKELTSLFSLWEANGKDYLATASLKVEEFCTTDNGHFSLYSSCHFFLKLCRHAKLTPNKPHCKHNIKTLSFSSP